MSKQTLEAVQFHGDTLFLTEYQGEPYTALKPISDALGLDWRTQRRKLKSAQSRWRGVIMTPRPGLEGQDAWCIPLRKLPGYLSTLSPRRVRPELRAKIERYQHECDDVLWQHWTQQHSPAALPAAPDMAHRRWLLSFDDQGGYHLSPLKPTERVVDAAALGTAWRTARQGFKAAERAMREIDQRFDLSLYAK